jgi:hypothetical protein
MNPGDLFNKLYSADSEQEVAEVLGSLDSSRIIWKPYGNNESNFGVMEAQQADPVPALVEKITNSIDAILMRRCLEEGIDPKSTDAPRSVEEAISVFFPKSGNWDLPGFRREQAESLQIIAQGKKRETSLVIYDDGEGQHPENFEDTFLSLLRGNKTEIQFVQGKYNMGGAGAIAFCGKNKYQLVASKKCTSDGNFGFTLVRRHPLTSDEKKTRRSTWYEFLTIDGDIPNFAIDSLDIGLHNRKFKTGSVLKLYSYQLPPGSVPINRDLNRSINELLFEPALPICIVEQASRYPNDNALSRIVYGLKRRLEEDDNKYIQEHFQQSYSDKDIGKFIATVYVFNAKVDGRTAKETKESIRNEYFKNNMSVTFSLNGQVHAPFTSEFISRTLKYSLIKDFLLIHVDCTDLDMEFRNELFMASRDRAKSGDEMSMLRNILGRELRKGRLDEVYRERKANIGGHGENTEDLLKNFSSNLPLKSELLTLLNQTFKLEKHKEKPKKKVSEGSKKKKEEIPFNPQRFPSSFKIDSGDKSSEIPVIRIPRGGERTISFSTDAEDAFFERVEEPGELKLGLVSDSHNDSDGGTKPGEPKEVEEVFSVGISSPSKGTIRINLKPENEIEVGKRVALKACLSSKVEEFQEIFEVQITEPEQQKQKTKKPTTTEEPIGLPEAVKVFENDTEEAASWSSLDSSGITMDHYTVMQPFVENEKLEKIYINMDSSVVKNQRAKLNTENQINLTDNRYFSTVYFHTLFLYMISKNQNFQMQHMNSSGIMEDVELGAYLSSLFSNHYSEFLMNFEMETLINSIAE